MPINEWSFPTKIRFGHGSIKELNQHLTNLGILRPLVVTDQAVSQLEFYHEIIRDLSDAGISLETYHDFSGNPIEDHVINGVEAYKTHKADGLILIGGGSPLDVGKAIALMIHHPGKLFDYEDNERCAPIEQPIPIKIAIPTTAGTGSEVGRSSVISDNRSKAKKIIYSPRLLPELVICDPQLTIGLPANVTAATGIDALTHLIEAYVSKGSHPMCEGIALKGINLIAKSLMKAVECPKDLDARGDMLAASLMGAVAFQKGLGVTHSCAHALSTEFDLHHGLANAMMLESTMRFNLECSMEDFSQLASQVGIIKEGKDAAEGFIHWYIHLKEKLKLPKGLRDLDVTITDSLIETAYHDICHSNNPRPVSRDQFRSLYEQSL